MLVGIFLCCAGCGGSNEEAIQKEAKAKAYRAAVENYLTEARWGATMLTSKPTAWTVAQRAWLMKDLHTKLPEPPAGTHGRIGELMQIINGHFAEAATTAQTAEDNLRDGKGGVAKDTYKEGLPDIAKQISARIKDIESALGPNPGS
jgi:hypothetical protein